MRIEIPLTGTVLVEGQAHGDGRLEGDPADPIRPINIDLGNVSWHMINVDLDREVMIVEVEGGEYTSDPDTNMSRPSTPADKAAALAHVQGLIHGKSKAELYKQSGSARLRRPFKTGGTNKR